MHICTMHYKSKDLARKIDKSGEPGPRPRYFFPGPADLVPVPVPGLMKNTGESPPRPRRGPRPRATKCFI